MESKTKFLILFLILLVVPTGALSACGKKSSKVKTEKSCCDKKGIPLKKSCCETEEKGNDSCNGSCEKSSCHCPSTVNIPIFFNSFKLSNTNNFTLLVYDWTYIQNKPKAVYLSIWQPPKIS